MSTPTRFRLDCAWCPYYVDAAVDSGTGERAALLIKEHIYDVHDKSWNEWLRAGAS